MPYRLFYADGSAAMGARVILEEVGETYELIETEIGAGMPRAPELLALNPTAGCRCYCGNTVLSTNVVRS